MRKLILTLTLTLTLTPTFANSDPARELKGLVYQDLYDNAREAIGEDDFRKAEEILDILLENYPEDADAQLMRGRVRAWQERYREAEKDLLEVTRNTPEYTDAWHALTDLYRWWNRYEDAEKSCRVCLELEPDTPGFYIKYARILIELRRYPQARESLLTAQKKGGDSETIQIFLNDIQRIQNPRVWEAGIALDYQAFNTNKSDWWGITEWVKRDYDQFTLMFEAGQYWRFQTADRQFAAEIYADAWRNAYWNFRGAVGWDHEFLPHFDLYGELYQGFLGKWEGALSYRRMVFSTKSVHIPALALAVYQGPFYLRYKFNLILDEGKNRSFHTASIRYYYNTVDDFVEMAYGYGRDMEWIKAGIYNDDSHVWILRGQQSVFTRWILQWLMNFQLNPNEETQWGGRIGVSYRW